MRPRMRFAAAGIAACAVAALSIASPAGAAHLRNVSEKVFPFPAGGDIVIESTNGRIVVEAWDRPDVRVQITREVRAADDRQAAELLRDLKADVAVHPGEIHIESIYPRKQKVVGFWDLIGHGVRSANIHYYLQVPRETSLDLSTTNGAIRVRAVQGKVDIATTNGDVEASSVRGSLSARTTNGEVRLARIEGAADAATTNGSIAVEMSALPPRGAMQMGTTNGNIELALPREVHANLEARTTNGRVNINYKLATQGSITSKSIQGTIGGGGVRIELQTTNGNIDVGPPRARASS
ncbi:MAG TPA: DUF4097 family beta strand repeat-containing protein [Candidatus Binatia bacterium]|nr:DUF4097 family beta strand repeat-containing protein [Candidatus Binatia bacterium]